MGKKKPSLRPDLVAALTDRTLVHIRRSPRYADETEGFVLGVGARWALISRTLPGGYPNGYRAIQVADVSRVTPVGGFEQRFARSLPTWPPVMPRGARLDDVWEVMGTLAQVSPLLCLRLEGATRRRECGRLLRLSENRVWLQRVDAHAVWSETEDSVKMSRITAVDIRDSFLTALGPLAGEAPEIQEHAPLAPDPEPESVPVPAAPNAPGQPAVAGPQADAADAGPAEPDETPADPDADRP
ncbi:hypothetical protein [Nigerium massiliense]|uniref:hypothetical protein n=1 Tax=Nigerium massiliense TaxID=1522317 RepID=UPI00058D9056|nr:hypothetical protein [Nigerium massiliense]